MQPFTSRRSKEERSLKFHKTPNAHTHTGYIFLIKRKNLARPAPTVSFRLFDQLKVSDKSKNTPHIEYTYDNIRSFVSKLPISARESLRFFMISIILKLYIFFHNIVRVFVSKFESIGSQLRDKCIGRLMEMIRYASVIHLKMIV